MKLKEKWKAIKLREKGLSYNKIHKRIPVSKSTLSFWLRDIELTRHQQKQLLKGREKGRYKGARTQYLKRIGRTNELMEKGRKEFFQFMKHPLFLAGLFLYWAEGDKHKKEMVKFTNSDPAMIKLMMKWFHEICHVPEKKFRIMIHMHTLHIRKNIKGYWSKITGISTAQFHKTYIKRTSLRHRRNVLYNGTCAIKVCDVNLFRKIMGWKKGLLEYFKLSPCSSMDRTKDF